MVQASLGAIQDYYTIGTGVSFSEHKAAEAKSGPLNFM